MTERIKLGEQLYRMLPEIYRNRDRKGSTGNESLLHYLEAHGHLLDLIHATFEQQLKDTIPDSSQEWLLPYFAQLLATDIISPDPAGKHTEVKNTVVWRQRKGTLKCAEEITEAIGQMEVEIQEGWKRVAMTPCIGKPLIPAIAHDNTLNLNMDWCCEAIRHPDLPAVMVDLRQPSRAIETLATNPAAKSSNFGGIRQTWKQMNRHGVPCFPDSYEDVSRRTVDIRTPDNSCGRYHHKRLLVFAPPPSGFFGLEPLKITWNDHKNSLYEHYFEKVDKNGVISIRNQTTRIIEITDKVELERKSYQLEGINFQSELIVPDGGKIELTGVEADKVTVNSFSTDEPVLTASDSLFREISSGGLVKLDSCTVLETAYLSSVDIKDSILMGKITGVDITGSIAYSRIPEDISHNGNLKKINIITHHQDSENEYGYKPVTKDPSFIPEQSALAARAVLSPNAPELIYNGASDHGEMGYYHRGRRNGSVHLAGTLSFSLPPNGGYPLVDIVFDNNITVNSGQLILIRSAAPLLTVNTPLNDSGEVIPSLSTTDCLFQNIKIPKGLARLEYCTVMENTTCMYIQASDCIFAGTVAEVKTWDKNTGVNQFMNCIRYSSLDLHDRKYLTNTHERPVFSKFRFCNNQNDLQEARFGDWGYGVLDPLTPHTVRFGAEDGGEMGTYHHCFHTLKTEAMLKKMCQFLPVGIEPVLIQDERLRHVPPEISPITLPHNGDGL